MYIRVTHAYFWVSLPKITFVPLAFLLFCIMPILSVRFLHFNVRLLSCVCYFVSCLLSYSQCSFISPIYYFVSCLLSGSFDSMYVCGPMSVTLPHAYFPIRLVNERSPGRSIILSPTYFPIRLPKCTFVWPICYFVPCLLSWCCLLLFSLTLTVLFRLLLHLFICKPICKVFIWQ